MRIFSFFFAEKKICLYNLKKKNKINHMQLILIFFSKLEKKNSLLFFQYKKTCLE